MSVFAPINNYYDPINYALTYYKNLLKGKSNSQALAAAEEATKKDSSAPYDVMLGGSLMKTAGVITGFVAGTIGVTAVSRSYARKKEKVSEPFIYVCTVTPNSGKVGQILIITFKGAFLNVYANGNYAEGFAITFGDLGNATLQTPTLDEKGNIISLPVTLTIPQNAKPGVRDISIKMGENVLATLKKAFTIKAKEEVRPPARKGYCDLNPEAPECKF
jgi:hypothetical protein